eukprot:9711896-Lingulodinium_polyedra.AAC.1
MSRHAALEGAPGTVAQGELVPGEYLYQSVRDNRYAFVIIELPGVQFGSSRRDGVRYSAISQLARGSVRNT